MKYLNTYLQLNEAVELNREIQYLFVDLSDQDFVINVNPIVLKNQRSRITLISEVPTKDKAGRLKARTINIKKYSKYPRIEICIYKRIHDRSIESSKKFDVRDIMETILFAKSYMEGELNYKFYGAVITINSLRSSSINLDKLNQDMNSDSISKLYLYFS